MTDISIYRIEKALNCAEREYRSHVTHDKKKASTNKLGSLGGVLEDPHTQENYPHRRTIPLNLCNSSLSKLDLNKENLRHNIHDQWTTERLTDEIVIDLRQTESLDEILGYKIKKYEQQARNLIFRIPVFQPSPTYIINLSDLSDNVKNELATLNDSTLDHVIKAASGRIFESVNKRYYLLSVRHLLKWELRE